MSFRIGNYLADLITLPWSRVSALMVMLRIYRYFSGGSAGVSRSLTLVMIQKV